ncbi:OPT/YSL family transporter, partial [Escherichia coli]|nr:OPT/YSL family transporter [Escherichia coli]
MGMYLPVAVTVIVPIGGLIGYIYNRWAQVQRHPDFARRMGTLVATGMIVGESLFGVLNAALIAGAAGESPLEVFTEQSWTPWFSTALF